MKRLLPFLLCLLVIAPVWAQVGGEDAARYLDTMISSVLDGNDPMRNRMFFKLRVLDEAAVDPLLGALDHESEEVRRYVAFTLGFLDDPRVVDPLLNLFRSDPETVVRCAAAEALGRLESADAVEPLIEAMNDSNASVRQSVSFALGLIGDPRAKPVLAEAQNDPDELVRFFAEEALVQVERAVARRSP